MASYYYEIACRGRSLREHTMTAAQTLRLQRELADLAHDPSNRHFEVSLAMLEETEAHIEISRLVLEQSSSPAARRTARRETEGLLTEARDFLAGLTAAVQHARHVRHLRDDAEGRERTRRLRESVSLAIKRIEQNLTQAGR